LGDARQAIAHHDLQQGGTLQGRVRSAQDLRRATRLRSDQQKRAACAQHSADPLKAFGFAADASFYWTPGSAQGEVEGSRALPAIWENMEDVNAKIAAFQEATAQLQSAAGTDLASLQGAIQGVGQACGACHDSYRADEE
jgi:cytochrome c556